MTSWLLALDTATNALSVAVGRDGEVRAAAWQRRRRGHAEELAPLIQRCLAAARISPDNLDGIAVTVGPGTFTGVRIGLAAARGMRVALKVPVIGINTLELIGFQVGKRHPDRPVLAALDARREQVYAQYFRRGGDPWPETWTAPAAMPAAQAAQLLTDRSILAGSGARLVRDATADRVAVSAIDVVPDASAAIGLLAGRPLPPASMPPPAPIYLRAADAVPAKRLLDLD